MFAGFSVVNAVATSAIDALPALLRALIIAPVFFLGTLAIGVLWTAWATRLRTRSVLTVIGALVAFCVANVWQNGAAQLFGWQVATVLWGAMGIAALRPAYRLLCESQRDEDWVSVVRASRWMIPIIAVLAATAHVFDNPFHFAIETLAGRGEWPMRFLFEPSFPLSYHAGFDVVAATLVTWGVPAPVASCLWVITLQCALIALTFLIVGRWVSERCTRWWIVACWALAESFGWFLRPFRGWLPDALVQLSPLYSMVTHSVFISTYARSYFGAFACVLLILWWTLQPEDDRHRMGWRPLALLVIVLAASAHSSETLAATLLPFAFVGLLVSLRGAKSKYAFVAAGVAATLLIAVQGGVLTDAIAARIGQGGDAAEQARVTAFHLRNNADFRLWGAEVLDLRSGWAWVRLFFEMGPQWILFVAAFVGWRRWNGFARGALVGGAIAIACAFIVMHDSLPVWMLRLFGHAFFVTNLLGAAVLVPRLVRSFSGKAAMALSLLGGVACLLFFTAASNIPMPFAGAAVPFSTTPALWTPFFQQEYLPRGSVMWVSEPRNHNDFPGTTSAQALTVFGAYLKYCISFSLVDQGPECEAFYQTPSAEGLDRLDVDYVLLTPEWQAAHADEPWMSRLQFQKRYDPPEWERFAPPWWRVDEHSWLLYRVIPIL